MDATSKFDGRAADYTAGRPGYSAELLDCLYAQYGLSEAKTVADIGSGTGKFSRQLLDRQSEVFCVEPNGDMRRVAEAELGEYPNFHSVPGEAENTTLKDGSVDCITAAQAFHWFDTLKFKQECLRIIKPGGKVILLWNTRNPDDTVNQAWHRVFSQYCPDYKGFSNGMEQDDPKIKEFFDRGYISVFFDHPLVFDREAFIKRSLSSSYSLKSHHNRYEPYVLALNQLFDKYSSNGTISVSNRSVAYIGIIK